MKKILVFFNSNLPRAALGGAFFAIALIFEKTSLPVASLILFALSLLVTGFPVFRDAALGILRRDFFDEKLLMCIGAIGAFVIGEFGEGAAVMLFFTVGEYFEGRAVGKSRASIKGLMDICPDEARIIRDGKEYTVDADEVEIGDKLVFRAGDRIAVDATVTDGSASLNVAHLTGESYPRSVALGDSIESGSLVLDGVLYAEAVHTAESSAAARILALVETASDNKSREENFITKFARYYTPAVVILALLVAVVPAVCGWLVLRESVYRALVFLVFSCPCALVISVPMAFFGGIGCAASRGILYKGGNTMSPLARAKTFAFDKTGTLTDGGFAVSSVEAYGVSEKELLYLTASLELGSNHPIAECLKALSPDAKMPEGLTEIGGKGVIAEINGDSVAVGNKRLMAELGIEVATSEVVASKVAASKVAASEVAASEVAASEVAATYVYTARCGKLVGKIGLSDSVKAEAASAIESLRALGAKKAVMLTGDISQSAVAVANAVGIDEVYSELLPENKYEKLKAFIAEGDGVVYVGDGINDAPSLALADVGVAMGGTGADSAIESADLVIMSDEPQRLPEAVKIARKTLAIAKSNIAFALGIKLLVLVLSAIGYTNMWFAVFADVGVALLAILNAARILAYNPNEQKYLKNAN